MPLASPAKWHLAHTTWFFERFVLQAFLPGYAPFDAEFEYLFNSYYDSVGTRIAQAERGTLTRPTLERVHAYREHVEQAISVCLGQIPDSAWSTVAATLELGLQHEQQHQELLVTDILHLFLSHPFGTRYLSDAVPANAPDPGPLRVQRFEEGVVSIGIDAEAASFAYDNESPRHRRFLEPYALATRPSTNQEYLAFVESGGYADPAHWLSLGWSRVQSESWRHPLYWKRDAHTGAWLEFTAWGWIPLDPHRPVCHLSYFEADAFARWSGARLPTEFQWEAAMTTSVIAHPARERALHPTGEPFAAPLGVGEVWEWTRSSYEAYPGYAIPPGALGEYNGKFMCNQYVLRGGSCATPPGHIRPSYRNFFPPEARWQFSGVRLAFEGPDQAPSDSRGSH